MEKRLEAQIEFVKLTNMFADLVHQQWAHWMNYMLLNYNTNNVKRWIRQKDTSYKDLSEKEQQSDIKLAIKFIQLMIDNKDYVRRILDFHDKHYN